MRLIRTISILFLLFSSLNGMTDFAKKIYNERINSYNLQIRNAQTAIKFYESVKPRNTRDKTYLEGNISTNKSKIDSYTKAKATFEKNFKENPKKIITSAYEAKKVAISKQITLYKEMVNRYKGKSFVSFYQNNFNSYTTQLENLEKEYKDYLASLKVPQDVQSKKTVTTISNNLKVSNLNTTSKQSNSIKSATHNVQLKGAALNTTTSTNNLNVGQKAKVNVGGVSLGEKRIKD